MKNQTLLEISTRPFLRILSEKYSRPITKLKDIPEAVFDEWRQMGFTWIWMMGVWEVGSYGIDHDRTDAKRKASYDRILPGWTPEDVIGSPYSIVSYTINPELGEEADIAWLREKLNERGMKLMLDFVPNHTAFDSIELKQNKREFYVHAPDDEEKMRAKLSEEERKRRYGPQGVAYGCPSTDWRPHKHKNKTPNAEASASTNTSDASANDEVKVEMSLKPWTDVAQLNYMNEELRKSRVDILLKIASQADGIRCDVADIVFNKFFWKKWQFELEASGYTRLTREFWDDAIPTVKSRFKDCVFIAEANYDADCAFKKCGFDFVYERLICHEIENKNIDLSVIRSVVDDPEVFRYAHMIENHDEHRSIVTCSGDRRKEHASAVLSLTLPGIRFFNQDQWCGYTGEIGVQLRRAIKEPVDEEFVRFYTKLLEVLKLDVMREGKYAVNDDKCFSEKSEILSWRYELEGRSVAVFVNFSASPIDVTYRLGNANSSVREVTDVFGDKSIKLDKENELKIHLETYDYFLIKY